MGHGSLALTQRLQTRTAQFFIIAGSHDHSVAPLPYDRVQNKIRRPFRLDQSYVFGDPYPLATIDIIPDIHGQAEKLRRALTNLGWRSNGGGWAHSDPARQVIFLGDFIDRGPDNAGVIRIVRDLMEAGRARAVMGNHELNALHFHMRDAQTGQPLRSHDAKNTAQHESFLREFPLDSRQACEVLDWMRGLPLFIEDASFRAVHAAWIPKAIDDLRAVTANGVLKEDHLHRAGHQGDVLHGIVAALIKGPEAALPNGYSFTDKGGHIRHDVRLKWWGGEVKTWREAAMSVPKAEQLPSTPLHAVLQRYSYPVDDRPVFFGHYWMTGAPMLQAPNALCLDYSAGTDGPLVSYVYTEGEEHLDLAHVKVH